MKQYNHILRSADEWDMPAGNVDVSFPRLQEKVYKMQIASPEKKRNSKDTADMLIFRLATTTEARDTDNNIIHPGFKFVHRINGAAGDRDAKAVIKDTAALIQAIEGKNATTTARMVWENPALLDGKLLYVKVGIQPAKDGFPEGNKVIQFIDPAKVST